MCEAWYVLQCTIAAAEEVPTASLGRKVTYQTGGQNPAHNVPHAVVVFYGTTCAKTDNYILNKHLSDQVIGRQT